jgi:hypothetical protein
MEDGNALRAGARRQQARKDHEEEKGFHLEELGRGFASDYRTTDYRTTDYRTTDFRIVHRSLGSVVSWSVVRGRSRGRKKVDGIARYVHDEFRDLRTLEGLGARPDRLSRKRPGTTSAGLPHHMQPRYLRT